MILQLLPEIPQVLVVEPVLQVGAGVVARRGVALEVDHVGRPAIGSATEEVVEPDLVEGGQRGEGRDVPTHVGGLVGLGHHGHGIPPHMRPDEPLHLEVAGVFGLLLHRDGVQVRCRGDIGDREPLFPQAVDHPRHQLAGLLWRLAFKHQPQKIFHRGAMPVGGGGREPLDVVRGTPVERGGRTVVGTGGIQDSRPGPGSRKRKGMQKPPSAKCRVGRFKGTNPK